jgi:hypothetical protein
MTYNARNSRDASPVDGGTSLAFGNGVLWFLAVVFLAAASIGAIINIAGTTIIFGAVQSSLSKSLDRLSVAASANGVQSRDARDALFAVRSELETRAAKHYEAPLQTTRLHIIALDRRGTDGHDVLSGKSGPEIFKTEFKMDEIEDAAVVFIVDEPTVFVAKSTQPQDRAKIAFESGSPIELTDAPDGFLAGFRISAFSRFTTTSVRDMRRLADHRFRQRFCNSLRHWVRYFDVEPRETVIWQATETAKLEVRRRGPNPAAAYFNLGTAERACPSTRFVK